jgi:uncharacterized protein
MSSPLSECPLGLRLLVRVTPKAAANVLGEVRDGRLQVKVTVAPEDGKANAAVVRLLAKALRLAAGSIEIEQGAGARDKTLLLRGMALSDVPPPLRARLG